MAQAGQLDPTFANAGIFSDSFGGLTGFATAIALQSNGKIVLTGESGNFSGSTDSRGVVLRLNTNGTLDTAFGSGGRVSIRCGAFENSAADLVIQTDGKTVISCDAEIGRSDLVRLNTDGSFDSSFGNVGFVFLSAAPGALVLQTDGKIVIRNLRTAGRAGGSGNCGAIERTDCDGGQYRHRGGRAWERLRFRPDAL